MDVFEYSIGIGSWIAVFILGALIVNGHNEAMNPIIVIFMPLIMMIATYLVIKVLAGLFYICMAMLYYMFRPEVVVMIISSIAAAASVFVLYSTYTIVKDDAHAPVMSEVD